MFSTKTLASIKHSITPGGFGEFLTVMLNETVVYNASHGKVCIVKAGEVHVVASYTRGIGVRVNVFNESFDQKFTKAIEEIADLVDVFYSSKYSRLIIVGSNYSLIFPFYPQEFKGGFLNPPADALRVWGERRSYSLSSYCFAKVNTGKVVEGDGGLLYIVHAEGPKIAVGLVDAIRCRQIGTKDFVFHDSVFDLNAVKIADHASGEVAPIMVPFSTGHGNFTANFFFEVYVPIDEKSLNCLVVSAEIAERSVAVLAADS